MRRYLKYLLVLLLVFTFSINCVNAKSHIKELFKIGDNIKIEEELDGTAFIAGEKVELNNKINGIGFIASNELNINFEQDYIFSAGTTINIKNNIEKDAFILGEKIFIDENVKLGRDAYVFADTLTIKGNIDRNIYVYGTTVNIEGNINGNIVVSALELNIDKDAKVLGTLKYNEDANIKGLREDITSKTYKISTNNLTFKEYITNFISSYIHITLLAIVLVFICEKLFKKSLSITKELTAKKVATLCGKGFLVLIGVPIIAMMLLFSGAFVSVGVVGAILYGILIYISNIFTAYFLATILDKKIFKKNMNSYLLMIIGLFIIYVLGMIPLIGGLISFISMLLGIGIAGNMLLDMKK